MTLMAHRRPHFRNPPIHEQAISLAYDRVRQFSIVDPGLFWCEIKEQFPIAETGPRFQAPIEVFDDRQRLVEWEVVPQIQIPKALFKNGLGEVVQLQEDSFTFNWIRDAAGVEYPRYEATSSRLWDLYSLFVRFIASRYDCVPNIRQCELTNVNVIPVSQFGSDFSDIARAFRVDPFAWDVPGLAADNFVRQRQHRIVNANGQSIGRLHSAIAPVLDPDGQKLFRFELTARSAPGVGSEGAAKEFFDYAHDLINGAFLESVTPAMREIWGEYYG